MASGGLIHFPARSQSPGGSAAWARCCWLGRKTASARPRLSCGRSRSRTQPGSSRSIVPARGRSSSRVTPARDGQLPAHVGVDRLERRLARAPLVRGRAGLGRGSPHHRRLPLHRWLSAACRDRAHHARRMESRSDLLAHRRTNPRWPGPGLAQHRRRSPRMDERVAPAYSRRRHRNRTVSLGSCRVGRSIRPDQRVCVSAVPRS